MIGGKRLDDPLIEKVRDFATATADWNDDANAIETELGGFDSTMSATLNPVTGSPISTTVAVPPPTSVENASITYYLTSIDTSSTPVAVYDEPE